MRTFIAGAALCVALTGCAGGAGEKLYAPIAGVPQRQTAEAAYWDCAGQNWHREIQQPSAWIPPIGVAGGIADAFANGPTRDAFMRYCMVQQGYVRKPHLELSTMTWQP